MARRTGSADLPLHGGRVPHWLAERMASLGAIVTQAIVHHYGRDEFLRRLSHPFWFQSFGAVMGMDWHSSGITTSVIGALKRGLAPLQDELGIHVCGGRGKHSRRTPEELMALGERIGFDGPALTRASRLVAKVDSATVQEMQALKRLDDQARRLEQTATGPSFDAFVAVERNKSAALGGRSVFGWEADLAGTETNVKADVGPPVRRRI
jgi:uncharacterized protein DUF763